MKFNSWFPEWAEGLKWRALTEKWLKEPLKLNNFYVLKFSDETADSHMETVFWFKLDLKILSLAFNKVLLLVMFNRSPDDDVTLRLVFLIEGSCTMNSSLKIYLPVRRYSDIAVPKPLELSNFCSVFNTESIWLLNARQVGRHGQVKHISLLNYSSLYPKANFIPLSLLFFYKKIYVYIIWVPQAPQSADP